MSSTTAWLMVAAGLFCVFASVGNFDWLHTREHRRGLLDGLWDDLLGFARHETDTDPTSRGLRQIGIFLVGIVLLVMAGGQLTGKWDLGGSPSHSREMEELRQSVPKPQR